MKDVSNNISIEKIKEVLTRGVEDVFIKENLEKRLLSGEGLIIKHGIDPTGPTVHLGRASVLRKVRALQNLGHKVILIVGDFTAKIGDPSDKLEKRPILTEKKIKENLKNYESLIGKIIDLEKAEIVYNSKWLSKLNFSDVAELAESFSIQQMSARRNFKDRIDKGQEISLREFLYPLMQGYDSVHIKADVEVGGFDQLFNLKAGRTVQKHYGMKEQDILTTEMLEGTDGRKMSTSWGNVINIDDDPKDMFGKIMSLNDELIEKYFLLCTDFSTTEIREIVKNNQNPKDQKNILAKEIVKIYHGEKEASEAEENFINIFQKKEIPDNIEETTITKGTSLVSVLIERNLVSSKTEWRRLISAGAIKNMEDQSILQEFDYSVDNNLILKIGKRRFIKIEIK